MYGLSGAHGTGKTTLAKALSDRLGVPFLPSPAAGVFRSLGITMDQELNPLIRLAVQNKILDAMEATLKEAPFRFISDRTPLDAAIYLMIKMSPLIGLPVIFEGQLLAYVRRCITLTSRYYTMVTIIQPGIVYVPTEGRPAPNAIYQETFNAALCGLFNRADVQFGGQILPRQYLDLNDRVSFLSSTWESHAATIAQSLRSSACVVN